MQKAREKVDHPDHQTCYGGVDKTKVKADKKGLHKDIYNIVSSYYALLKRPESNRKT